MSLTDPPSRGVYISENLLPPVFVNKAPCSPSPSLRICPNKYLNRGARPALPEPSLPSGFHLSACTGTEISPAVDSGTLVAVTSFLMLSESGTSELHEHVAGGDCGNVH